MGIGIKDMVYSLFGNYANSAKVSTMSPTELISNNASYVSTASTTIKSSNTSKVSKNQAAIFKTTFGTRADVFDTIDSIKHLDISRFIIETIVDDAFNSFNIDEPFETKYVGTAYNAEDINKRIQKTIKRLNLYSVFRDMAESLVTYGEHYLETICKEGVGITEVNNTVSTKDVLSLYENYELIAHIAKVKSNHTTKLIQIPRDRLSHFSLDNRPILTAPGDFGTVIGSQEIIRVGRSVLFPVLKQLERYNLLDVASLAQDLKSALMPPLISIAVTDQMPPDKIIEMVKNYEEYFMEMGDALLSLDATREIHPSELIQIATRAKIVPKTGSVGGMERPALSNDTNLYETLDRLEKRIKSALGFAAEEEGKSRFALIKEKSRYAKKLIDIHIGSAKALNELFCKDLRYQGIIIDPQNLKTTFSTIQNPEVEDDATGMYELASSIRDVLRTYVEATQDIPGVSIKPEKAVAFLDKMMSRYPELEGFLQIDEKVLLTGDTNNDINDTDVAMTGDEEPENTSADDLDTAGLSFQTGNDEPTEEPEE